MSEEPLQTCFSTMRNRMCDMQAPHNTNRCSGARPPASKALQTSLNTMGTVQYATDTAQGSWADSMQLASPRSSAADGLAAVGLVSERTTLLGCCTLTAHTSCNLRASKSV